MILVINAGSSSLKYKLFQPSPRLRLASGLKMLSSGNVERIGIDRSVPDHGVALKNVFAALERQGFDAAEIRAVGHRVVHGGEEFVAPTRINARVISRLKYYSKLAPLHNPPNVMGIEAVMKLLPGVPNVAVFDTAFYRTLPDYAFMYALPYGLYEKQHIRKYGFHGISHAYIAGQAAKRLKKPLSKLKLVTCHLGAGDSVTAVRYGKAIETSMGFTPLEGLTMATRCGDIDAAIPTYLIRTLGMTAKEVDELMNKKSGTLGICGRKDMRDVIAGAKKGDKRSKLALAMFAYDVARYIGQFAALMGGADAVVFTAGIGEHSAFVRSAVMRFLPGFKAKVMAIPTDEESAIAEATAGLLHLA